MRIISKYKDYYDFLQGIYGIDNKLILDRREGNIVTPSLSSYVDKQVWRLFICGRILEFIDVKGKFYFGDAIAPFSEEVRWTNNSPIKYVIKEHVHDSDRDKIYYPELSYDLHNIYKFPKSDNPLFLFSTNYSREVKVDHVFPRLTDIGINKVISAKDMWLMLSDWLSQKVTEKEPIVPIGDDKIRIQSAGFDLKTSFRPKLKS